MATLHFVRLALKITFIREVIGLGRENLNINLTFLERARRMFTVNAHRRKARHVSR